jgi:hypothetical protein
MRGKVGDGTLMAGTRSVGRDCTPGRGAEICTAAVAVARCVGSGGARSELHGWLYASKGAGRGTDNGTK